MGKRTHQELINSGSSIIEHIATAIREAEGAKVTISRMADELNLSRRALKHNIEVWRKEQKAADLKQSWDWQIVENWLTNLHTPVAKRKAYADLIREVIENAEEHSIKAFSDVCRVLGLPYSAARQWYAQYGGADRPMLDGRKDTKKHLINLANAFGDTEQVQMYQMAELAKIQDLQDLMAPRVEEIESAAA